MNEELGNAVESFVESAQFIADTLPKHLKKDKEGLRASFPRKVIRPLKEHYDRWPYLSRKRKRTVACTIQLCDVNRWHLNVWDIGLTAGTMWMWHCTLPVIAVIETLSYEFGRQYNLVCEDAKFNKVINTLQSKGVIGPKLRADLHSLREYRNGIHLYLQEDVEMHEGKPRKYNDAVRTLRKLENRLQKYWEANSKK